MVNDSVREELQTKVGVSRKLPRSPLPPATVGTMVKAPTSEAPFPPIVVETAAPKVAVNEAAQKW